MEEEISFEKQNRKFSNVSKNLTDRMALIIQSKSDDDYDSVQNRTLEAQINF